LSAERQQELLAHGFIDIVEIERRFAFIAQHFENGRAAFLGAVQARDVERTTCICKVFTRKFWSLPPLGPHDAASLS
jgi:hypothetical protein